jgi:UDP-galactopyranose mutase
MERPDLCVVGGGISGLSLAWSALRAGRKVLLLEADDRIGGCLHSARPEGGTWFELGAHTAYNSYGGLLALAESSGAIGALLERGPARASFGLLRDGAWRWLTPPKVLLQLDWLEVLRHAPLGYFHSLEGETVGGRYRKLLGPQNYARVLGPFLAAVPSQPADDFPLEGPGSLFKTRPRRKDVVRSFGFDGGLQRVCDAVAAMPGLTVLRRAPVDRLDPLAPRDGTPTGFRVHLRDGRSFEAPQVGLACSPAIAAGLVDRALPVLSGQLRQIRSVTVDTLGFLLPADRVQVPPCAFLVPVDDTFYSCVTRDPFPDPRFRAFTFHFKPDQEPAARRSRAAALLGVDPGELQFVQERRTQLPSPRAGHADRVAALDRALEGQPLALTGNYFDGLAIEDCIQRSFAEWSRLSRQSSVAPSTSPAMV